MAHADIPADRHPRRRIGCVVLITLATDDPRDPRAGSVLMVQPSYKNWPILPGGAANGHELIGHAAARELAEETGLVRTIMRGLLVDQIDEDPLTGSCEGINVVCDGGTVTEAEAARLTVPAGSTEITKLLWIPPRRLDAHTAPYQAARVYQALDARATGNGFPLLHVGQPYGPADAA
ncbi:NUDIX domain-containing protein [Kitasatospora sp. NPDC059646]|uniref:NUDIX domain-containing protein n=1 Tax=Kitasatospora sp. NPDC059646 TaxID=3346893 RepID=UPI0036D1A7BF